MTIPPATIGMIKNAPVRGFTDFDRTAGLFHRFMVQVDLDGLTISYDGEVLTIEPARTRRRELDLSEWQTLKQLAADGTVDRLIALGARWLAGESG